MIDQAGPANLLSPVRKVKSNSSFMHADTELHHAKDPCMTVGISPQPTGVGRASLSFARNIRSSEQTIGEEERISKKADCRESSKKRSFGSIRCGGTVELR